MVVVYGTSDSVFLSRYSLLFLVRVGRIHLSWDCLGVDKEFRLVVQRRNVVHTFPTFVRLWRSPWILWNSNGAIFGGNIEERRIVSKKRIYGKKKHDFGIVYYGFWCTMHCEL